MSKIIDRISDNYDENWQLEQDFDTKEKIENIIYKAKNYQDLCDKSLYILGSMENNFKETIKNCRWVFDEKLDVDNPITIFEKKWVEILKRLRDIIDKNEVVNAWIQLAKDIIVEELFTTREQAIQNYKDDISDGLLSNKNNIDIRDIQAYGKDLWKTFFFCKEYSKADFEKILNNSNLPNLMLWTFNIYEGSWAFRECFNNIKKKLWNQNLFNYIDSLKNNSEDQISDVLKYSVIKMLLLRRKVTDLTNWVNWYQGDKESLLRYIEKKTQTNEDFKLAFLTSISDLEKISIFSWIIEKIKDDPKVKEAYQLTINNSLDDADVFTSGIVNALVIYDDEWHGGGWDFFKQDLLYYKNKGYSIELTEKNQNYTKYILEWKNKKDEITIVQLNFNANKNKGLEVWTCIKSILQSDNYNLFALRGHCYNTSIMARELWNAGAIEEKDILIDWWCWNAPKIWDYYQSWVKWYIFAYTAEWRGSSTQSFIEKIINSKSNWKRFTDIIDYYGWLNDESWIDWYFANNVQMPNSVASQYIKLSPKEKIKIVPHDPFASLEN